MKRRRSKKYKRSMIKITLHPFGEKDVVFLYASPITMGKNLHKHWEFIAADHQWRNNLVSQSQSLPIIFEHNFSMYLPERPSKKISVKKQKAFIPMHL